MSALDLALLDDAIGRLPHPSLHSLRRRASSRFQESGLPTVRDEAWRYTDLTPVAEVTARWLRELPADLPSVADGEPTAHASIDAHWLVIRNGEIDAGLPAELEGRATIERLPNKSNLR